MKINKSVARFFVLLANLFLFVHGVYPHVHNDDVVATHSIMHDSRCASDHSACNHSQEEKPCSLTFIVLPHDRSGDDLVITHIPQPDFMQCIYLDIAAIAENLFVNYILLENPERQSIYISHITQVKGLRAPPCC